MDIVSLITFITTYTVDEAIFFSCLRRDDSPHKKSIIDECKKIGDNLTQESLINVYCRAISWYIDNTFSSDRFSMIISILGPESLVMGYDSICRVGRFISDSKNEYRDNDVISMINTRYRVAIRTVSDYVGLSRFFTSVTQLRVSLRPVVQYANARYTRPYIYRFLCMDNDARLIVAGTCSEEEIIHPSYPSNILFQTNSTIVNDENTLMIPLTEYRRADVITIPCGDNYHAFTCDEYAYLINKKKNPYNNLPIPDEVVTKMVVRMTLKDYVGIASEIHQKIIDIDKDESLPDIIDEVYPRVPSHLFNICRIIPPPRPSVVSTSTLPRPSAMSTSTLPSIARTSITSTSTLPSIARTAAATLPIASTSTLPIARTAAATPRLHVCGIIPYCSSNGELLTTRAPDIGCLRSIGTCTTREQFDKITSDNKIDLSMINSQSASRAKSYSIDTLTRSVFSVYGLTYGGRPSKATLVDSFNKFRESLT